MPCSREPRRGSRCTMQKKKKDELKWASLVHHASWGGWASQTCGNMVRNPPRYLNDVYLQADTYNVLCQHHILDTARWWMKIGFVIHPTTADSPCHVFAIHLDRHDGKFSATPDKKATQVQSSCPAGYWPRWSPCTIRDVTSGAEGGNGWLVACFSVVFHGKLHYRNAERDQIAAIKYVHGNYDIVMKVGPGSIANLQWWSEFLSSPRSRSLTLPHSSKVVLPAASKIGWVAVVHTMQPESRGGGCSLNLNQRALCLNSVYTFSAMELLAVFFALMSARMAAIYTCSLQCFLDNVTAVSYVLEMGMNRCCVNWDIDDDGYDGTDGYHSIELGAGREMRGWRI